jgi:His-Xaa-Ser system radical SAM maturase HxsC
MISLMGTARNIGISIIGRISHSAVGRNMQNKTILISGREVLKPLKGSNYAAIIMHRTNDLAFYDGITGPHVLLDDQIDRLWDGDVVEILPSGRINVLYELRSRHNVLFVTSRCNSRCIMCPQPIEHYESNLTERNLDLISLMDNSTAELALTGGEPTIIGSDLFRLILACKALLPETTLLLLTNARKFSDFEYTHFFSSLKHPNLTVSTALYGDNEDEHDFIVGAKGAFDETLGGILNLASFGHRIEIRTVLHRYTYRRLVRLTEFVYRNMPFVTQFVIMGMETIGTARDSMESLWISPDESIEELETAIHYGRQRGMKMAVYNVPLCLLPKAIRSYARQSISEWKNSFAPECSSCSVKDKCSGLFSSGVQFYRRYLQPISFPNERFNIT